MHKLNHSEPFYGQGAVAPKQGVSDPAFEQQIQNQYVASTGRPASPGDVDGNLAVRGQISDAQILANIANSSEATRFRLEGERAEVEARFEGIGFTPGVFDDTDISRFTPPISPELRALMDTTAGAFSTGPLGSALAGKDFQSQLADFQQQRRQQFSLEVEPAIQAGFAGGARGEQGATFSGAGRAAVGRARQALGQKETGERFQERQSMFNRAVSAAQLLPVAKSILDTGQRFQQGFTNAINVFAQESGQALASVQIALKRAGLLAAVQESFEGQSLRQDTFQFEKEKYEAELREIERKRREAEKSKSKGLAAAVIATVAAVASGGATALGSAALSAGASTTAQTITGATIAAQAGQQFGQGDIGGGLTALATPYVLQAGQSSYEQLLDKLLPAANVITPSIADPISQAGWDELEFDFGLPYSQKPIYNF